MFRPMRRKAQQLSAEDAANILKNGSYGVLALHGDEGYPYAVPLNYVYDGEKIYFHCALTGHKTDALQNSGKCSFCIVAEDKVVPEEYTTFYQSIIAFGKLTLVEDIAEKTSAIEMLAKHFHPTDSAENRDHIIGKEFAGFAILRMYIEHITGKQSKHLMK